MIPFEQFCTTLGLVEYPFSQYATENELAIRSKLFYPPSDYAVIVTAFNSGQSLFIIGNRGTGKTAILYDLADRAEQHNRLYAVLDDFSKMSIPVHENEFYGAILRKLTETLARLLVRERYRINRLDNRERMLLTYLFHKYLPSVSRADVIRGIEAIQHSKLTILLTRIYNLVKDLLNYGITMAIRLSSDALRQHFTNLPPIPNEFSLREYFPEIKLVDVGDLEDQPADYSLLARSLSLVSKLGWSGFVLLVDKLDEDRRFRNNANEIARFLEPIVSDNKLLLNPDIQLVISIWEVPFKSLTGVMRSQKHFSPRLRWERGDLEGALNRRLQVFSRQRVRDYRDLFDRDVTGSTIELLFNLANGNPRDLWHIFNKVFRSQYSLNPAASSISEDAIRIGFRQFVAEFNYYEYYPKPPKNERGLQPMDVYSYIRLLLRVGNSEFNRTQFRDATGVSGGSVSNYLGAMQAMGLITSAGREGTRQIYRVVDPKVVFAIKERVEIRNVV